MKNLTTALGVLAGVYLGYWIVKETNKENKTTPSKSTLLCSHVDTVDGDEELPDGVLFSFDMDVCPSVAETIVGGRALCTDHYEDYISEMTKTKGD